MLIPKQGNKTQFYNTITKFRSPFMVARGNKKQKSVDRKQKNELLKSQSVQKTTSFYNFTQILLLDEIENNQKWIKSLKKKDEVKNTFKLINLPKISKQKIEKENPIIYQNTEHNTPKINLKKINNQIQSNSIHHLLHENLDFNNLQNNSMKLNQQNLLNSKQSIKNQFGRLSQINSTISKQKVKQSSIFHQQNQQQITKQNVLNKSKLNQMKTNEYNEIEIQNKKQEESKIYQNQFINLQLKNSLKSQKIQQPINLNQQHQQPQRKNIQKQLKIHFFDQDLYLQQDIFNNSNHSDFIHQGFYLPSYTSYESQAKITTNPLSFDKNINLNKKFKLMKYLDLKINSIKPMKDIQQISIQTIKYTYGKKKTNGPIRNLDKIEQNLQEIKNELKQQTAIQNKSFLKFKQNQQHQLKQNNEVILKKIEDINEKLASKFKLSKDIMIQQFQLNRAKIIQKISGQQINKNQFKKYIKYQQSVTYFFDLDFQLNDNNTGIQNTKSIHITQLNSPQSSTINSSRLSSIFQLFHNYDHQLLQRLIEKYQSYHLYCVWLYIQGRFKPIFIDGNFPYDSSGNPLFTTKKFEFRIIEKAIAKLHKGYKFLDSIQLEKIISYITGLPNKKIQNHNQEKLQKIVKKVIDKGSLFILERQKPHLISLLNNYTTVSDKLIFYYVNPINHNKQQTHALFDAKSGIITQLSNKYFYIWESFQLNCMQLKIKTFSIEQYCRIFICLTKINISRSGSIVIKLFKIELDNISTQQIISQTMNSEKQIYSEFKLIKGLYKVYIFCNAAQNDKKTINTQNLTLTLISTQQIENNPIVEQKYKKQR